MPVAAAGTGQLSLAGVGSTSSNGASPKSGSVLLLATSGAGSGCNALDGLLSEEVVLVAVSPLSPIDGDEPPGASTPIIEAPAAASDWFPNTPANSS